MSLHKYCGDWNNGRYGCDGDGRLASDGKVEHGTKDYNPNPNPGVPGDTSCGDSVAVEPRRECGEILVGTQYYWFWCVCKTAALPPPTDSPTQPRVVQ